jgi:predicted nucleotidyltransferase
MDDSLLKPLAALNRAGVEYVVVGGIAVILQGVMRMTSDIDLMIDLSPDNWARAVGAFRSLGYVPRLPVDPLQLADPAIRSGWINEKAMQVFAFIDVRDPAVLVDVMTSYPIAYQDLKSRSRVVEIDGIVVRISSVEDLIAVKTRAGRPQDLQDVSRLKELQ